MTETVRTAKINHLKAWRRKLEAIKVASEQEYRHSFSMDLCEETVPNDSLYFTQVMEEQIIKASKIKVLLNSTNDWILLVDQRLEFLQQQWTSDS